MQDSKSKRQVLEEYFFEMREIWNDIDTLERQTRQLLGWLGDMHSNTEKYNGEWIINPSSITGRVYRVLNKISDLSEKYANEEMFEE